MGAASAQALALRSRIVLESANVGSNIEVAERLNVNRGTVAKWRNRFVLYRLDGLLDEPRPGLPRTITDELVERVISDGLSADELTRDCHCPTLPCGSLRTDSDTCSSGSAAA